MIRNFSFFLAVGALLCAAVTSSCRQTEAQEAAPLRVMPIGASITMGQGVNGGYRLPLEQMFQGAGIPMQFVGRIDWNSKGMTWPNHDGYPGHRIDQIENGATNAFKITSEPIAPAVRELRPDAILLFVGTNDVRQNYKLDEAPARLDHLVGTLMEAAPDARILVSNLTSDQHFDDAVRRYNADVAALVARRAAAGQKVQLVDNYSAVNPATDMSGDLTHPDAGGYIKIARTWFRALEPNAPQIAFGVTGEGANEFAGKSCLGYQLTMKRAATVTDLGIYCAGKPLKSAHAVGVFDESGQMLSQLEISPQAAPSGLFVFGKLANPLNLQADKTYFFVSNSVGVPTLVGAKSIVDPLHFDDTRFYFDHNVAVTMDEKDGTILKFPGAQIKDINGGISFFGPNFRLAPE